MGLMTRAATVEHWIVTKPALTGFSVGQSLRVLSPPEGDHWIHTCAKRTTAPLPDDPEFSIAVDPAKEAEEARQIAATVAEATKPDVLLSSEEVWKICPALKNPELFNLAMSQYRFKDTPDEFPTPQKQRLGNDRDSFFGYKYSKRALLRWMDRMRAEKAKIVSLIG